MDNTSVSYTGKTFFVGIDVHRAFFVLTCFCDGEVVKRCRIPSRAEAVIGFVSKHFPDADVRTCYEAGYSGFWLHRALEAAGISNIVVHPAHVPLETNRIKTDKRDSLRLAQLLAAGRLRGIRVPTVEEEQKRVLTRTREQLMGARRRVQARSGCGCISLVCFRRHIQRAIRPLDVVSLLGSLEEGELKVSIELLYSEWLHLATAIKGIDRRLAQQAKADSLEATYRSIPGVGKLIGRVLSNELGDMSQFANERALFSFTGLTPGEYSSGDRVYRGHISRKELRDCGTYWLRQRGKL